jgi:trehalose/maltose hydrolase-like predicted phosphorylase
MEAGTGSAVDLLRVAAVCTDFDEHPGTNQSRAVAETARALADGWDLLLREQYEAWERRWDTADVRIDGCPHDQRRLRFCIYQLLQAYRGNDGRVSLGAKFMTGDHYAGHTFWDADLFDQPFYLYTTPAAARALAAFRVAGLEGAREKARLHVFRGAFYPWESDPTGRENCPTWWFDPDVGESVRIPCGEVQIHINLAVVIGLYRYYEATSDEPFWREHAAPVILESARFLVSWADTDADGSAHIRGVIGPDEYHEYIDDNYYTNYLARWSIALALTLLADATDDARSRLVEHLGITDEELADWQRVHDRLHLPERRDLGILEVHDGFCDLPDLPPERFDLSNVLYNQVRPEELTRYRVLKQADLIALFAVLPGHFPSDLVARCWDYYTPLNRHDSSLSHGSHCRVALTLGRDREAYAHFQEVLNTDLAMGKRNSVKKGIHAANAGNAWNAAVLGFGGISVVDGALHCSPRLPRAWAGMRFPFVFRGRTLRFAVTHTALELEAEAGPELDVRIAGEKISLGPHPLTVRRDLAAVQEETRT